MEADVLIDPTGSLSDSLQELLEALKAAPAIVAFRDAERRFQADGELRRLRTELQESGERLQGARMRGVAAQALLAEVREKQAGVQSHPLVLEYVTTKGAADDFLRGINRAISAIVGLDVADAGRPAGGC